MSNDMDIDSDKKEISDAEKMRQKRLAKVQAATAASPAPISPAARAVARPAASASPAKKIAPASAATPRPNVPSQTASTRPAVERFATTYEAWEDDVIGKIFGVTLKRESASTSTSSMVWLKTLHEELVEDGEDALRLRQDLLDRILLARLSPEPPTMMSEAKSQPQSCFEYLVQCWKRCSRERSALIGHKGSDAAEAARRQALLEQAKTLVVSYAGLVLQDPTMFPQPAKVGASRSIPGYQELLHPLLNEDSGELLSPPDVSAFIADLAKRFIDDGLEEILGPVVRDISLLVLSGNQTMAGMQWRSSMRAVADLVDNKQIASVLPRMPNWSPDCTPQAFELMSLLGPLIRLGCFPDGAVSYITRIPNNVEPLQRDVSDQWFQNASERTPGDLHSALTTLRGTLFAHQDMLFRIFNAIIRSGPASREAVLTYWAKILRDNIKRSGSHFDHRIVASHSFMNNLHGVLLRFAEPFVDATFSRIDKVNVDYFRYSDRLDVLEETKLHATISQWKEYKESADANAEAPNFVSEIFFIACGFFHLGLTPAYDLLEQYTRQYQRLRSDLDNLNADQSWIGGPQEQMVRTQQERLKKVVDRVLADLHAYEVQLLDPGFVERLHHFCSFSMAWLIRIVDPKGQHPQTPIQLPLPEEVPQRFAMLPEFLIEDIVTFYENVSRFCPPEQLASLPLDQLLNFIVVFLSTNLVNNPYLKGKMVDVLFYNTRPTRNNRFGALGDAVNTHPLSLRFLVSSLIRIYIDIETTGTHTQFYDKFYTRNHIANIFKIIWENPAHRQALRRESEDPDKFVRFINLLMNDTTYLLDESLTKLHKISEIQREKNSPHWEELSQTEREDKEKQLQEHEGMAKTYCSLSYETVRMLVAFTGETAAPFVRGEIVDRLASMLDFNLETLAGPKCQQLKVQDPKKYGFRPRELLQNLMSIFLNLAEQAHFQAAVAREGRSYSQELFKRAADLASRNGLKTEAELASWYKLVEAVETLKADDAADEEAEEPPDEFLDPLVFTLMRDPVILPQSKQVMDRSSIIQHLLSDPRDPFTSTPLKIEDVVPDTELKARIEDFITKRKEARLAKNAAVGSSGMDTT